MKILIEELNHTRLIKTGTIKWLEANGNYTNIFIADGSKIVTSKILKHYENLLQEHGFCRIHNKYIINMDYVDFHSRGRLIDVTMKCKTILSVAARRKQDYLKSIHNLSSNKTHL